MNDTLNGSLAVDALERAMFLLDHQKTTAQLSDKNQNKKRLQADIDAEAVQLRSVLYYMKTNPRVGKVIHRDDTGPYRSRIEVVREIQPTRRELLQLFMGGMIRFRAMVLTEGVAGRVLEAASLIVTSNERDVMKPKTEVPAIEEEKKGEQNGVEDTLEKVVQSEPLETEMKTVRDGNDNGGKAKGDT